MKKIKIVLATIGLVLTGVFVAAGPSAASPSHYAGGDYGLCVYPTDGAYDGIYVEGYGLTTAGHTLVVAHARVVAAEKCVRKGATYHIDAVRIDKVYLRSSSGNSHAAGPYTGALKVGGNSGSAVPPCGKYVQTAFRWSARWTNGHDSDAFTGTLRSDGFKRC